jgi:hypothetical protein
MSMAVPSQAIVGNTCQRSASKLENHWQRIAQLVSSVLPDLLEAMRESC